MSYEKSQERLRILVDDYHADIVYKMGNNQIKYVHGEILIDNTWDSIFSEPCLQLLFYDIDDELIEAYQYMPCRYIKAFSSEDDSDNELFLKFNIPKNEITELFDMVIIDLLTNLPKINETYLIVEIKDYNDHILELMFEIDYFNNFDNVLVLDFYEHIHDVRFLPTNVKDIFIF